MGAKLDPQKDLNVPSHRITVTKKKTPKKFDGSALRGNPAMNQTQIVFSGKDPDLMQDVQDLNLPNLVGSAQTSRNVQNNSQEIVNQEEN